jgi:PKD repeat protein
VQSSNVMVLYIIMHGNANGTYSTCKNPTHTYFKAGKYTVTLTIKDAEGNSVKKCKCIVVSEPPRKEGGNNNKKICKDTKKVTIPGKESCNNT